MTDSDAGANRDPVGRGRGQHPSGVTDHDGGAATDRAGYGRNARAGASDSDSGQYADRGASGATGNYTGRTDSDSGANSDRSGYGRTGMSDNDSGSGADRAGYGRGGHQGVTDHDTGVGADASGQGRGSRGATDSDSGANADQAGHGRGAGGNGITDHDSGANADRAGYGRGQGVAGGGQNAFPNFPWPLPRASEQMRLERGQVLPAFGRTPTLGTVGTQLTNALDRAGYTEHSFYGVPKGFALVSRLEHIQPNGRPFSDDRRWSPPESQEFGIDAYIRNLFVSAPVGYYRFIVFVVTDQPLVFRSNGPLSAHDAQILVERRHDLPGDIRAVAFGPNYQINVLVYEYQKTGPANVDLSRRGRLPALTHLSRSGIYSALMAH